MNATIVLNQDSSRGPSDLQNTLDPVDADNFPELASFHKTLLWRIFDIIVAITILIVAFPFLLLLAGVLFISDPGSVFFNHRRIGQGGSSFLCMKFRTMKADSHALLKEHLANSAEARKEWAETHKLKNDPRITRIGGVVRKLSLDEFPQLINILRGEMSIVGPRPIVQAEIERYGRFFEHYCHVKPGLTGLWQVSGRNNTTYAQRVAMDVEYVARKNIALDCWLIIKTVPAVFLARGSY